MKFMGVFAILSVATLALAAPEHHAPDRRQGAYHTNSAHRDKEANATKSQRSLVLLGTMLPLLRMKLPLMVRPTFRLVSDLAT